MVFEKSHNLVLSCAMATSNPTHKQTERQRKKGKREREEEIGKERANKTARVKCGRGEREANGKKCNARDRDCDGYLVY